MRCCHSWWGPRRCDRHQLRAHSDPTAALRAFPLYGGRQQVINAQLARDLLRGLRVRLYSFELARAMTRRPGPGTAWSGLRWPRRRQSTHPPSRSCSRTEARQAPSGRRRRRRMASPPGERHAESNQKSHTQGARHDRPSAPARGRGSRLGRGTVGLECHVGDLQRPGKLGRACEPVSGHCRERLAHGSPDLLRHARPGLRDTRTPARSAASR